MSTSPDSKWAKDWQVGVNPTLEKSISNGLIAVFSRFWDAENLDTKSKSTRQRYSGALHALGGYLVQQAVQDGANDDSVYARLLGSVEGGEGPLIFPDNEGWQRELDAACRKLSRYLKRHA
ncbi:MAG: hypothetical protein ACREP2_13175 [Rhodanobacteraceae bacterium]